MAETAKTWTVTPESGDGIDYAARKPVGQQAVGPIYTLTDLGELAARLKSIDTFDRRGNVMFLDDFESGNLAKWMVGSGDGSVALSNLVARSGGYSCQFTTLAILYSYQDIVREFPYPYVNRHSVEFHITIPDALVAWTVWLYLYKGTTRDTAKILFDSQAAKIQYGNSAGVDTDLATSVDFTASNPTYKMNAAKLVVDFANGKYSRLMWNNTTYDMSQLAIRTAEAAIAGPSLLLQIRFMTMAAAAKNAYIDDVLVKQNEPE